MNKCLIPDIAYFSNNSSVFSPLYKKGYLFSSNATLLLQIYGYWQLQQQPICTSNIDKIRKNFCPGVKGLQGTSNSKSI